MNIFTVLSSGKSSLHEPAMSAMLGHLLDPHQEHGLGATFLGRFLDRIGLQQFSGKRFQVDLEVQYRHEGKRNDIDVQLKIMDSQYNELHRIAIENKIKTGAVNPKQLSMYHAAILGDTDNDDAFTLGEDDLTVVFLTPDATSSALTAEYGNLHSDRKVWLKWGLTL